MSIERLAFYRFFTLILILSGSISCFAAWEPFGPDSLAANRACFVLDNTPHWGICHDEGLCLYDLVSHQWTDHPSDLPVLDAFYLNGEEILVIMGCGTDSDGIYAFDPDNGQYEVLEYLECPNFIRYDEITQKYYIGHRLGLVSSTDGLTWTPVSTFDNRSIVDMDIYQNHIVVSQLDNIYSIWHSDDHGVSWTQSPAGTPMISDLVFGHDQKLYGIFPDESWSSGLWSSTDFGYTWEVEFWAVNMKCVGVDVFGDVFVGWDENPTGMEEGLARWDPGAGALDFINEGLTSLVINEVRVNPTMSAIALFCCTESGAYISFDYFTGMDEENAPQTSALDIFPNPAMDHVTISWDTRQPTVNPVIQIFSPGGEQILEVCPGNSKGKIEIRTSGFSRGIYMVMMPTPEGILCRKLVIE